MIDLTTLLEILAGLIAAGIAADVIVNYEIKQSAATASTAIQSTAAVATQSVVSTATTAINSINATASEAIDAILAASGVHDVFSISKEKVKANSSSGSSAPAH